MPNVLLYLSLFGLALILVALGWGARMWAERAAEQARKVAQLQEKVDALERRGEPASKHDAIYLARHDMGEAVLFDLAKARETVETLQTWIEYASRRAAHVASGGRPDDPPTKWGNGASK